jgi:hypothetical protein
MSKNNQEQKTGNLLFPLNKHRVNLNSKLIKLISTYHNNSKVEKLSEDQDFLRNAADSFSLTLPIYIYEFIRALTNNININNSFDPWLTLSSPIIHIPFINPKGICISSTECSLINKAFNERNISITEGISLNQIDKLEEKFDLIVSITPLGMRTPPIKVNEIEFKGDYGSALLVKSLLHLSPKGKAIFVLSGSFLPDDKYKNSLVKLGFRIEAIFYIPPGAFLPTTNIPSYLVLASIGEQSEVFAAEVSSDERINKTIISNFLNRKVGKEPELGCLVQLSLFKSFPALISLKEFEHQVRQVGYNPIQLYDLAISINSFNDIKADEINHLANSIYLPKIGNSEVVTSPLNLKIKPQNYYQICIDETKANATYVANYFNSQLGLKLRKSLEVGSVIQQIPKSNLRSCLLHLPDLNTQIEIIQIDSKINQFNYRLEELKRSLWKFPRQYKNISKELKSINQEEKLEHWIDTLPFPISSILWRYYATKSSSKQIEHLFHFFEALSEFFAMIMLSGLVQDKEFYRQECHNWVDKDEKFKDWYLRASFGSWNILTARLAKATREYLSDKLKKDLCKSLYGNPNDNFLIMITNKGIINILTAVADLRNKWKGHGGITSEQENRQRVTILEQELNELREHIADGFEETIIVAPSTSSFEDGIFNFNVKELLGARTPFNEISINSLIPLDKKKLYLVHKNQTKPIELLPFIKYVEASDAIYFYTSIESKDVRWVSYHFEKEAELRQPVDNQLYKAFDFLK